MNKRTIMSLLPAFELGLWNAWIFILFGLVTSGLVGFLINQEAMNKFRIQPDVPSTRAEKIVGSLFFPLTLVSIVYSLFLPIKLGTTWFYLGLTIWSIAFLINFISIVSFASTSLDELVTKGTYRISRNPVCPVCKDA